MVSYADHRSEAPCSSSVNECILGSNLASYIALLMSLLAAESLAAWESPMCMHRDHRQEV